ncbi:MAG TPA: OmpA family protein [Candidatus Acidoferrum sp.]|jgi:outer membrane protein OmpA-like peptidoglycan-associated protein|nr:OmpA family protein [Candidatus Acidoferrum sp.]
MSSQSKSHPIRVFAMLPAMIAVLCTFSALAAAQDQPAPKWELFGGYSFLYPNANVHGVLPGGLLPVSSPLESNPRGAGASITYDFNRWFGLTLDASTHWGSGETGLGKRIDDAAFSNLSFGPKVTFRGTHVSPFLELLVGDHRLMPDAFHDIDKLGFMIGGGLDFKVSQHVALRLPRVDYVMSSYRYGPSATTGSTDLRGIRAQAGLVFTWGGERTVTPPRATCSVQPPEAFAGEPVTATAEGSNFNPKRTVKYSWSGSGLKTGASGASTEIDSTSLQPGSYQVTASLSDGSKNGVASCTARFTVKAPRPPVISCASDPASVPTRGTSTITSTASSPDGRSLTYSYSTSAGNITGNTSTATLDTAGAQPGTITVTCNVSDDRTLPLTASSTTTVNLQAPPPPPPQPDIAAIEKRLALHSVYFATAKPTLENPEAGLLASQEKTLTALATDFKTYLQSKPDARLTLEGHADPRGSVEYNQGLSERRVDRVKHYLVEQGVPAANLQTKAFGKQENLTDAQVKDAVERNPELSPQDRQRVLNNMRTIILASNRRVDITLSNTGQASQESVRQYPFNAADSLTLLKEEGTKKTPGTAARKKAKPKAH